MYASIRRNFIPEDLEKVEEVDIYAFFRSLFSFSIENNL